MKKYAALSAAALLLVAFLLSLPAVMGWLVTPVDLVRPSLREVNEDIYASGTVEEQNRREVTVQLPLVPGSVAVEIGDRVEPNQVIAEVDQAATRAALLNLLEAADLLPEEAISVMGGLSDDVDLSVITELGLGTTAVDSLIPQRILAPAGGVVTALSLAPGAIAQPGAGVCTISQLDALRVKLTVEESYADRVQAGDTVVFKAGATGEEKYVGQVTSVFPAANRTLVGTSQQTVVGLYVSIDNGSSRLKPGYSVNGVIKKGSGRAELCVPYEAVLQDDANQEYVYVWERARAVRRDVETGEEFADGVGIVSGLTEQDLVVADASRVPGENSLLVMRG